MVNRSMDAIAEVGKTQFMFPQTIDFGRNGDLYQLAPSVNVQRTAGEIRPYCAVKIT